MEQSDERRTCAISVGRGKKKLHSDTYMYLIFGLERNCQCTLISPRDMSLFTSYTMTRSPFIPLLSQLSHDFCWSTVG